ncbi:hypothetical protein OPT61_g1802 [Boeremia exigua]|uniref:Uncharacterized protein n=1 Tax=Boeremia exigua TaxID=749465 RepID=A0ACC2IP14_9PLEO|nr:hypothetical protein OPT61_g1802 [Boeremia exigua]
MRVLHNEARKQFTIALRTSALLHGAEDEQAFVAQYDADNLTPGTIAFDTATIHLPGERRSAIARNADPQIMTLSLSLNKPCPLWCPRLEALAPKPEPGAISSFNELVALAKAMKVHIIFDYKWLHKDTRAVFQRLVKGKERLSGYPLEKYYAKALRLADWTIFSPADAAAAPPTYAEPPQKRPRQVSHSTPSPHPPKRQLLEQVQSPVQILSPTECATSPSVYANEQDEYDFQYQAISRVVVRHLPGILKEVLPDLIKAVFPTLLTLPASFESSFDSEASQVPNLTPIGAALIPHILAHIQPQLQKMQSQALSSALQRREEAALDFEDDFEFHKAELMQIRDDGIDDLQREATDALHSAQEKGADWAEELAEEAEEAVCARLDALKARMLRRAQLDVLEVQNGWMHEGSTRDPDHPCLDRARRSWSRHGGKGGYRGLGQRWMNALS